MSIKRKLFKRSIMLTFKTAFIDGCHLIFLHVAILKLWKKGNDCIFES